MLNCTLDPNEVIINIQGVTPPPPPQIFLVVNSHTCTTVTSLDSVPFTTPTIDYRELIDTHVYAYST